MILESAMTVITDELARLQPIDVRDIWKDEARNFTPWLAKQENLDVLAATLEMDLRLEATEQNVGHYRADVVCKDLNNDDWVLVENQLERTDHSHLGQLITYAAGLEAVSIVWIAKTFSEPHRAALDWLNEMTGDSVNFFGLEIELWRIDDSRIAPKFNLASKPNFWTKGNEGKRPITRPERLACWTAFREYLKKQAPDLKPGRVSDGASIDVGVGWKDLHFKIGNYADQNKHFVRLAGRGEALHRAIDLAIKEKTQIEAGFGGTVFGVGKEERPNISPSTEGLKLGRENQDGVFNWYVETIRKLKETLEPHISDVVRL